MKNELDHDEIDLRFVYKKIKGFFSSIWSFILNTLQLSLRKWKLILLFSIIGVCVGAGLFFIIRPVYSSTLIVSSNTLTNDYCSDIINNIELIIKDNSPELLAKKLKIDVSSAKEIKELEFDNYDEKLKKIYKDKDTIVLGRPFKINAYTFSNTVFETLQKALVKYMENNEYALKRKEIKIANLNNLRAKIKTDIHQLDSLKFVVVSNMLPRGTQNGFVFGQPIDPMNMFKEEIILFKEDLLINKDLELSDNIQVIQDFYPREKPNYPRLRINIPLGGIAGFITGLILAFILENRKKLLMAA